MLQGFKQFILKGNVVDLAVGVIIGASFGAVVTAVVKGLITPLIGVIGGTPNFSGLTFSINRSTFLVGDVINALIIFLINAAVIYFLVILPMNRLVSVVKKEKPVDPTTKKCSECLSIIPLEAKRCAFCTAVLTSSSEKKK